MDRIKMVVDSVCVKNKDPLVIGVAMISPDGNVQLSFQVTEEHYKNYQLRELFMVSIEPI